MYKLFASWYFGGEFQIEVRRDFPQQNNAYDCGVMMLFGIKDVVRDYHSWSFSVNDCRFKRYQLAYETLTNKITGFD